MRKTFTKDFKLISKFLRYLFHLFPGLYMHIFNMLLFLSIDSFLGGLFSEFNQYLLPYGFFGGVGVGRDWLTFGGERIQKNWCCECDPEVNLHYIDVCLCCPGNTAWIPRDSSTKLQTLPWSIQGKTKSLVEFSWFWLMLLDKSNWQRPCLSTNNWKIHRAITSRYWTAGSLRLWSWKKERKGWGPKHQCSAQRHFSSGAMGRGGSPS